MSEPRGKARADGEGSIYQRQDSKVWVAAVSYRDPATGKRKQRTAKRRTKGEALAALDELRGRVAAKRPLRDSTVTLADWSHRWEASTLAASGRRQTTRETYAALMKSAVRPRLGGVPLGQLRRSNISAWLVELEAGGSASRRRHGVRR